jgi:two-component system, sensor histidine kinase and response regulator
MDKTDFNLAGMQILIVDDTPANIDMLRKILETKDFIISIAPSGEVALKLASRFNPDLILMDIMMPGIDGFETCQKLKNDPITKEILVIFLYAKTEKKDVVQGFSVGGVDYIRKPFNAEEVLVRIRTQLQLRLKTKKLEETQGELKRSNEDFQAFTTAISHDLKAPLRNILRLGKFLQEDY